MTTRLDLNDYHFRQTFEGSRTYSEFTLIGTWLHTPGELSEPCLVIIRRGEERNEYTRPAMVLQKDAFVFAPESNLPKKAASCCVQLCQILRMNTNNVKNILRIQALIDDHLDDLLKIPPYSRDKPGDVIAEITLVNHQTGKTIQVEREDNV